MPASSEATPIPFSSISIFSSTLQGSQSGGELFLLEASRGSGLKVYEIRFGGLSGPDPSTSDWLESFFGLILKLTERKSPIVRLALVCPPRLELPFSLLGPVRTLVRSKGPTWFLLTGPFIRLAGNIPKRPLLDPP